MLDRKEIKVGLAFGSQRKIARLVGVTEATVSLWFSGKMNSQRIEKAALEMLADCVVARNANKARFEAAMRGEKI